MTKIFKITKTAWIAFLVSFFACFFMASISHAQTTPSSVDLAAKKYRVSFPIVELGGCSDYAACRNYCEDPVNAVSCINFAKSKGFYKEDTKKTQVLEKAKVVLGCESEQSCKTFCQQPENYDKCDSFAKQNNISGGHVDDPAKKEVLDKAKAALGCDSPSACSSFCSKDENKAKCSEFAKEAGLRGGEKQVGPGGCSSPETCRAFCSDPQNYKVCAGFTQVGGGNFSGPGGCNSEESCRTYCQAHPNECTSFGGSGTNSTFNPQEACNRTPNCAWSNNNCQCGYYGQTEETKKAAEQYALYCSNNPGKCQGAAQNIQQIQQAENYCKQNPEKCRPQPGAARTDQTSPTAPCPNTYCSQSGYAPDPGASCACKPVPAPGTYSGGSYSSPNYSGNNNSYASQEAACKAGGGTCSSAPSTNYCGCQGYKTINSTTTTNYSAAESGCRSAGGTWTGSSCNMPSGQNVQYSGSMSRESQEAGCHACAGSCNWNGDFCNCQCGNTGSSGSIPQPAQDQPTSTENPSTPPPSPTVQGISTLASYGLLDYILKLFQK